MCSAFNDITAFYFFKKKKPDVDIEFTEEGVLQYMYFDVHMYLFSYSNLFFSLLCGVL